MIITLTGSNSYALSQAVRANINNFLSEQSDMGLERLDGDEATIDRISEALTSPPFLTDKKMIVIRNGAAHKQFAQQVEALLTGVPETTDVILFESKLDKRSSYYKYLKKFTDYQEFTELDPIGLTRWLVQSAAEQGGSLSQNDARLLVERVGHSQQLVASELSKLLLYSSDITRDSILALTEATPQSTIFELLEAAFAGNTKRALQLYNEQRALKVEPQQIIALLTWQLHILALIKTAGQRTPDDIAREAKVSPYVIKKSVTIARALSHATLKLLIADLIDIDQRSKREAYTIDDALQLYILSLK